MNISPEMATSFEILWGHDSSKQESLLQLEIAEALTGYPPHPIFCLL